MHDVLLQITVKVNLIINDSFQKPNKNSPEIVETLKSFIYNNTLNTNY